MFAPRRSRSASCAARAPALIELSATSKAIPMRTPRALGTLRNQSARSAESAIRACASGVTCCSASTGDPAQSDGDLLLGLDAAVEQVDDPAAPFGNLAHLRRHDDGDTSCVHLRQDVEKPFRSVCVEVAGRFVGQHDVGPDDERARHRDPLLLTIGELVGQVVGPVHQADRRQGGERAVGRSDGETWAYASGSSTFCRAVERETRLKSWKTKPMRSRRTRAASRSSTYATFLPASW